MLVHRVITTADCSLGGLGQQRMSVVQHDALHLPVPGELLLKSILRQAIRGTGELYDCMAGPALPPRNGAMPSAPSFPTLETCADAPSAITYKADAGSSSRTH